MATIDAFNINGFVENMKGDGARPNLFKIEFQDQSASVGESFTLRAESSALPGSTIGVASAFYFGREAKFAGNRRFDDWTVQILNDEIDYKEGPRHYLELWMNKLNGHIENKRVNKDFVDPSNYMKDGYITHYGKSGDIIGKYTMVKCFPTSISPINLSWDANDQIERFSVTFAMQWWEASSGSTDVTGNNSPSPTE